jgi:tRNA threonylcarbamoyl adenosine modification protein YjeE
MSAEGQSRPRTLLLPDEHATERLAQAIAAMVEPGDAILLSGELGAGKTRFARAMIDRLAGDGGEVPSPTFTLVQTYDTRAGPVWHADLFRLEDTREVAELGLEDALGAGILIVEWPERWEGPLPPHRLEVGLEFGPGGAGARTARLAGHGRWRALVDRLAAP